MKHYFVINMIYNHKILENKIDIIFGPNTLRCIYNTILYFKSRIFFRVFRREINLTARILSRLCMYEPETLPANRYLIDLHPCSAGFFNFDRVIESETLKVKKSLKNAIQGVPNTFFLLY